MAQYYIPPPDNTLINNGYNLNPHGALLDPGQYNMDRMDQPSPPGESSLGGPGTPPQPGPDDGSGDIPPGSMPGDPPPDGGGAPPPAQGGGAWMPDPSDFNPNVPYFGPLAPVAPVDPGTIPTQGPPRMPGAPSMPSAPTVGGDIGPVPDFGYFDGGPVGDVVTQENQGNATTMIGPDGNIILGNVTPTTREVQDEELVQNQLSSLLNSNSKYMQDARRQGLEQSNAVGGLGGTAGIGASMTAALRAAAPIAQADAMAFRQAASENMQALNQFSALNLQRATQLEGAQIDARSRQLVSQIQASSSMAMAKLQSATDRDLGKLNANVQLINTQLQGQIQSRLANAQYQYTAILNNAEQQNQARIAEMNARTQAGIAAMDATSRQNIAQMDANARLQSTALQGQYQLEGTERAGQYGMAEANLRGQWAYAANESAIAANQEMNYLNLATGVYDGYLNRIAELNGIEMDDAARNAAIATITQGAQNQYLFLNSIFPNVPPIEWPGSQP